jgi:hypothetical protein
MPAARRLCSLLAALTLAACAQGSTTPTPVGYRGDDRDAAVPVADPLFGPVPTPDAPGATRPTEPPADAEHAPDAVLGDAEHRAPAPVVDDAAEPGDARPAPVPDSVPPDAERALAHPSAPSLLGLHDVMRVAYSTDFDWAPAEAEGAARAADRGLVPVLRVDYARPEASAYADGTPTAGASLPPPGRVGYCLARRGGPGDLGPSRDGGDHLDCYLAYLDDLLAAPGADRLHTFVIGNEPNIAAEARAFPGQVMPADWVATVYRAARARIRSHPGHAQDRVFLGAVSPGPAGAGGRTASGDDALVGLLGVLAPAEVDGLAVHAYGGWLLPADNGGEEALQVFERALYGQLSLIDALGHGHTPVMLTEFSALVHRPTDPDGPRKRALEVPRLARFITDAYRSIDAWNRAPERHNVLAALYFTLGNPGFPHEWLTPYRPGGTDAAGDARTNPWLAFRALADAGDLEAGDPARGGPCAAPPAALRGVSPRRTSVCPICSPVSSRATVTCPLSVFPSRRPPARRTRSPVASSSCNGSSGSASNTTRRTPRLRRTWSNSASWVDTRPSRRASTSMTGRSVVRAPGGATANVRARPRPAIAATGSAARSQSTGAPTDASSTGSRGPAPTRVSRFTATL